MAELSHQDGRGQLRMVDVGGKSRTLRLAEARGRIILKSAFEAVRTDQLKKGSVLECARIAGIQAAKKTANLIPLCHAVPLTSIKIDFSFKNEDLIITAIAQAEDRTGVEMEALTAVSVALLTVYDMAKALERSMEITDIWLVKKTGGEGGIFCRSE